MLPLAALRHAWSAAVAAAAAAAAAAPLAPRGAAPRARAPSLRGRALATAAATAVSGAAAPAAGSDSSARPLNLCAAVNEALHTALEADDSACVFGEDVAFGGVFRATVGLQARFVCFCVCPGAFQGGRPPGGGEALLLCVWGGGSGPSRVAPLGGGKHRHRPAHAPPSPPALPPPRSGLGAAACSTRRCASRGWSAPAPPPTHTHKHTQNTHTHTHAHKHPHQNVPGAVWRRPRVQHTAVRAGAGRLWHRPRGGGRDRGGRDPGARENKGRLALGGARRPLRGGGGGGGGDAGARAPRGRGTKTQTKHPDPHYHHPHTHIHTVCGLHLPRL